MLRSITLGFFGIAALLPTMCSADASGEFTFALFDNDDCTSLITSFASSFSTTGADGPNQVCLDTPEGRVANSYSMTYRDRGDQAGGLIFKVDSTPGNTCAAAGGVHSLPYLQKNSCRQGANTCTNLVDEGLAGTSFYFDGSYFEPSYCMYH